MSEILIEIHTFSFKKMQLKMLFGKCRLFCLSLNALNIFVDGNILAGASDIQGISMLPLNIQICYFI